MGLIKLSHCFNGHVDYARETGIAQRLYELSDPTIAMPLIETETETQCRDRSETLKCLEFDADQSALWASCNIQLGRLENIEGIAGLDQDLRLRLTIFGAYAMTWLIDAFQTYSEAKNAETHPDPSLRLQNLFRTVATRVEPLNNTLPAQHRDVLNQFDAIRSAIPSMYGSQYLTARMADEVSMNQLKAFDERGDELKKELREFEFSAQIDGPVG